MTHQEQTQEQLVGYWIKRFGISKRDLDNHPQIDDVMLLIKFAREFKDINNYRQKQFTRIWRWVYTNQMPLKAKHLRQLNHIGEQLIRFRTKRHTQRTLIKLSQSLG